MLIQAPANELRSRNIDGNAVVSKSIEVTARLLRLASGPKGEPAGEAHRLARRLLRRYQLNEAGAYRSSRLPAAYGCSRPVLRSRLPNSSRARPWQRRASWAYARGMGKASFASARLHNGMIAGVLDLSELTLEARLDDLVVKRNVAIDTSSRTGDVTSAQSRVCHDRIARFSNAKSQSCVAVMSPCRRATRTPRSARSSVASTGLFRRSRPNSAAASTVPRCFVHTYWKWRT